jgi:hypothetical protein
MLESTTFEESIQMPGELVRTIMIRKSNDGDRAPLKHLAELDGTVLPAGPFLLAEIDGELAAAVALSFDNAFLGDPFRATENVYELLAVRRRQLRAAAARNGARPRPWGRLAKTLGRTLGHAHDAGSRSRGAPSIQNRWTS